MLRKIKMGGAIFILSLLALVGCQSEKLVNDGGSQQGQQFSLTASKGAKSVGSRTALDGNQTIWSEDDAIYVSSEDNEVKGTLYLDPESLSPDKTTATFTGFVIGGDPAKLAYSVFPAPKNGGKIIDLSIIEGGGEVDAPFIGRINTSDDVDVRFEHVCGVAPIVMNGYQGEDIVITGTNNNTAVKFLKELDVTKVNLTGEKPEFIIDNIDETENITITSPKGGQMYVPYYLKTLPTTDNIVVFKNGEKELNKADLSNGFVGKVHSTTVVAHTMKEDGTTVQNTSTESKLEEVEGVSTAVVDQKNFSSINSSEEATSEDTQYFNVSGLVEKPVEGEEGKTQNVVAEAVEVTLPKVVVPTGNEDVEKSVEISFTNVAPSTTITIQEEESTSDSDQLEKSIKELTVVLPSGTTVEEAKEAVNINMPNTTVTVKSDDGNILIINEMTAATAEHTLVVGADVEIKSLTIKKGKVQVFGKVGEIKRDPHNEDEVTVVTIEKGGIVNAVFGKDRINVIDNNRPSETPESIPVSTFAELKSALESQPQTEITMIDVTADITLTEPLVINKRVQMHLGNNSLTIAENFVWGNAEAAITSNANLYLSEGNIKGCNATAEGKYLLRSTDIVNIYNVSLETNGVSNGFSQINKIAHFRGASSITATKGNAIHVLINKTEKGSLGVQLWGTTQINGSIAFELTCEPVENAFVAVCLLENSELNGRLDIIQNGFEGHVEYENKSTGGGESSDDEATSVANLTELTTALMSEDVQNILLTAPLIIEVSEAEELNLNGKVITVDKGVWEQADAAITVKPKNTADGSSTTPYKFFNISNYSGKTCKIEGEAEDNSKYLIKSTGVNVNLNSTCLQATGNLNTIYVEDANLNICENSNITSITGYALNIKALNNRAEVFLLSNSTINGAVHFNINCDTDAEGYYSYSSIIASQGCAVNGKLTIDGDKSSAFELITKASEGSNTTPKINDIFKGEGWSDAYIAILQRKFSMGSVGEDNGEIVLKNGETIEFRVSDKTITQIGFRMGKISGDGTIKFVNGTDQTISLSINIFDLGDNINLEFENGDKFKKELHIYSNRVKELFGLASGGDHVRVYLKQNLTINEGFVCGTNMSRIPEDGVWGCLDIELAGHTLTINSPIQVKGGAFGIVGYEGGGTISSGIEFIKAGAAVSGKETIQLQITPDVTVKCTNITWFGVEGTDADWTQNKTVSFDFMAPEGSSKNDKVRIGRGYELVKVENGEVISGNVHL